jgi:hypothetical protein
VAGALCGLDPRWLSQLEDSMSMTERMNAKTRSARSRKRPVLVKRTLRDLTVRRAGPKAGFIMQDTVIVPTGRR